MILDHNTEYVVPEGGNMAIHPNDKNKITYIGKNGNGSECNFKKVNDPIVQSHGESMSCHSGNNEPQR